MPVERTSGSTCLIDLFDRMRNKGLVITRSGWDEFAIAGEVDRSGAARNVRARIEDPAAATPGGQPNLTKVRLRVVTAAVRTYLDPLETSRSVEQFGKSRTHGRNTPRNRTKG